MAEIVGLTSSIIAIAELSAKLVAYSNALRHARVDISRMQTQLASLDICLKAAQHLINDPKNQALVISRSLIDSVNKCQDELAQIQAKLDPGSARKAMRKFGLRAFKWPFDCREINEILTSLEQYKQSITLCLQMDQTTILLDISQKFEGVSLGHHDQRSISHTPCFNVPFDRDSDFVHRPDVTEWLKEQYTGPSRRMALVGLGGLGKSQVAIHFAHQTQEESPETNVFWVHASSKPRFEEGYRSIAEKMQLPKRDDPGTDILALVRDFLQTDGCGSWLMILDNADDLNLFYSVRNNKSVSVAGVNERSTFAATDQRLLAAYLPKCRNGNILITSRSLDVAERLTGSHKNIFQISIMDNDQGLQLFRNKLIGEFDEAEAIELLRALDYIPLAITQTSAYINRRAPRESVRTYLDTFRQSDQKKSSLLNRDAGDLRRDDTVSNSVITTWQVTFEQIRREAPSASRLLSFMSFFNPHGIPEFVLRDYSAHSIQEVDGDLDDFENDLDVLRGYSLVSVTAAKDLCEMHAMVQVCTRTWISNSGNVEEWRKLFLQSMSRCFPNGEFETWPLCKLLLPHLESVTKVEPLTEDLEGWAGLLLDYGYYMKQMENVKLAEELTKRALTAYTKVLGENHPDTLDCMEQLAAVYRCQCRWEEAKRILLNLTNPQTRVLGEGHRVTLRAMDGLAQVYRKQARYDEAEEIRLRLLEVHKLVLGEEHPHFMSNLSNLAVIYFHQGRFEKAEEINLWQVKVAKRVLGEDHPDTLASLRNIAVGYMQKGEEHPDTLMGLTLLASTYAAQDRMQEAEEIQRGVVDKLKEVLGEGHPDTLRSLYQLGRFMAEQGRFQESLELMRHTAALQLEVFDRDHPEVILYRETIEELEELCEGL
ncbi:kinesin light chain [Fusarium heterosporum]|uniref:Kinesin light chain n=1 Tax=Fusarium heterosporum TaxID=42747 RepID=A0A8H5WP91_FUSHE|nr:kinesin light chain [Fusarium heterosporum]